MFVYSIFMLVFQIDNGGDDADTNSSSGSSGGINMVVMIDTEQNDDANDVFINNRKGNSICQNNRNSPGFCDEVLVTKTLGFVFTFFH